MYYFLKNNVDEDNLPLLKITLHPIAHDNGVYDFRFILDAPMDGLDYYFISVVSHTTSGNVYRSIDSRTTILSLRSNDIYNVTISTCNYLESTSYFVIGMRLIIYKVSS